MPDCHLCKRDGHPTIRCLSCKGPLAKPDAKPDNKGQRFVPLDSVSESDLSKLQIRPPDTQEDKFEEFMRLWLRMPSRSRDLLAKVIVSQPRSNAKIARTRGVTRQAVSRHLIKIARAHPELQPVLRLRLNNPMPDKQDENVDQTQTNPINTVVI